MGDLSPREMEKLILGYEELEGADKALADQYLQEHPALGVRLKWHQSKEAIATTDWPEVENFLVYDDLSAQDQTAQQESLRLILAHLNLDFGPDSKAPVTSVNVIRFSERLRRQMRWALPLAAILALAMVIPRIGPDRALLQNLTVIQIQLLADGSRGPELPTSANGVLHTGQAFALDFSLDQDAYVVVFHVGPSGQASLVYPGTIADTLQVRRGGMKHRIPGADSEEVWILGSETGTESFLVVSSQKLPRAIDQALTHIPSSDRAQVILVLQARLEELADQVTLYEFQHVD
jgi:Domain of unknown function (DUF4384)